MGPFLAGACLAPAGCVTTTETVTRPRHAAPVRFAASATSDLSTGLLPLGTVPYDNRSLPLADPSGRFVATQVGDAPSWETLLASPRSSVPGATRVEIYEVDRRLGEAVFRRAAEPGLLLGRGGDAEGFLVESPRPNGERWIGLAPWQGGKVRWLVADGHVNAFATLGRGGRLAWSRRTPGADHFELVIRREGQEWTMGSQDSDWLLPLWSGSDDGLFALHLEDGRLDAVYMRAPDPETAQRTLVRTPLAADMTMPDAYQCVASQAYVVGAQDLDAAIFLFWHPGANRIGLWRPESSPGAALLLEPQSFAAALDPSGLVLVTTPVRLILQSTANPGDQRTVIPGPHVARPVTRDDWPYLLLSPSQDQIGLMFMRLVGGREP